MASTKVAKEAWKTSEYCSGKEGGLICGEEVVEGREKQSGGLFFGRKA